MVSVSGWTTQGSANANGPGADEYYRLLQALSANANGPGADAAYGFSPASYSPNPNGPGGDAAYGFVPPPPPPVNPNGPGGDAAYGFNPSANANGPGADAAYGLAPPPVYDPNPNGPGGDAAYGFAPPPVYDANPNGPGGDAAYGFAPPPVYDANPNGPGGDAAYGFNPDPVEPDVVEPDVVTPYEPPPDLGGDVFEYTAPENTLLPQLTDYYQGLLDMLSGDALPPGYEDLLAGLDQQQEFQSDDMRTSLLARGIDPDSTLGQAEINRLLTSQRAEDANLLQQTRASSINDYLGPLSQIWNQGTADQSRSLADFFSFYDRQFNSDTTQQNRQLQALALMLNALGIGTINPSLSGTTPGDTQSGWGAAGASTIDIINALLGGGY